MEKTNVEILFDHIDHMTETIQHYMNETYLDSLSMTLETIFYQGPSEDMADELKQKLDRINTATYETEEIRKAVQLGILKGMKGTTQHQHLMTPEAVALFVGYLAGKITGNQDGPIRVFDPASGTGNLLLTVVEQLDKLEKVYASEVDPTLIKLAVLNANLQQHEVEFFHQDSLRPFLMDPVDLVVTDLPVGYYPDDIRANDYQLKADEGHSYSHHLFIEQSINYTKEGGYLIFVIPEFLFDSDQSDNLHAYLHENAHVVGVLQLPETAFKSEKNRKSILILQKSGPNTSGFKQPLLAQIPSFKNTEGMNDILTQINEWFSTNMNK